MEAAVPGAVFDGGVTARPRAAVGRPPRFDVLIAGGGLLGGLLLWTLDLHGGPPRLGLPAALTLVSLTTMSAAELMRRTAPMAALALAVPALALDLCAGTLVATVLMFTDVVYAAVLHGPAHVARRIPPHSVLVTVLAAVALTALWQKPQVVMAIIGIALITIAPAWTGIILRNYRNYRNDRDAAQAARLRAEQIALLAERDRARAVAGDRARMARELHDMVANHLSAIAIHSTAAQSIDDPAAAREALGVIRENSVQGLAEMRRLIRLLRGPRTTEGGAEPAATPTLDGLEALIEQARTSGRSSGPAFVPDDARSPVGPGTGPHRAAPAEPAAYRIAQESLTNALKHAAPCEVLVRLAKDRGGALTVAVRSPFADRPGPRAPGTGTGLVGMRERAALLGGAFEAGPESGPAGRVWLVRAALPAAGEEARR